MEFVGTILKCDNPTPWTGRIYPREEVEKAIEEYMQQGTVTAGELDHPGRLSIDWDRISHTVEDTYIDSKGNWIARIEMLDTDMGHVLQANIENGLIPRLGARATGIVDENAKVSNITIAAIDALADSRFSETIESQKEKEEAACLLIQELPSKKDGSQALPTKKPKSNLMQSILHWIKSL